MGSGGLCRPDSTSGKTVTLSPHTRMYTSQTRKDSSLCVPEAARPRLGYQQGHVLGRPHLPLTDSCPPALSSAGRDGRDRQTERDRDTERESVLPRRLLRSTLSLRDQGPALMTPFTLNYFLR